MNEELRIKEDWVECVIKDVGEVLTGGTPSKKRPDFYSQEDYPFYKPTDLNAGINVKESKDFLSALGYENSRKAIKNSILVTCIGATIGKTGLIKREGSFNQQINALLPNEGLSNVFLYYQIIGSVFQQQIKRNASSTTLPILNKSKFLKLKLNLPPYLIQKTIVKKIEELFSSLDSGIADLKKAQDQLVIYRQAVLKKAFEGEYEIKKLGEVAEVKRGKSKHRPRNDKSLFGGKYPFIQTGEIRATNGGTITKYKNTYSEKGLAQSKLWPKGTLCLTIAANIGETAFLGFDACFPDSVVGILPNQELLNSKYLNFYIQKIKEEMDSKASATAQKNINVRILDAIEIPIPTEKEQHQIVQEIESRLSVCDTVEKDIADSLEKAQALRQSILKKAFEGKLLSEEEIAKCKAHPDYEPASVLLEKIKLEKLKSK